MEVVRPLLSKVIVGKVKTKAPKNFLQTYPKETNEANSPTDASSEGHLTLSPTNHLGKENTRDLRGKQPRPTYQLYYEQDGMRTNKIKKQLAFRTLDNET